MAPVTLTLQSGLYLYSWITVKKIFESAGCFGESARRLASHKRLLVSGQRRLMTWFAASKRCQTLGLGTGVLQ
jgi:hypothetical protein